MEAWACMVLAFKNVPTPQGPLTFSGHPTCRQTKSMDSERSSPVSHHFKYVIRKNYEGLKSQANND